MELKSKIEVALFVHGEPMDYKKLSKVVSASESQVKEALEELGADLSDRGLDVVIGKDEVQLVTSPELSDVAEKLTKEELDTKLTPAALETLSVIAYIGPCSRALIEYIRGVNSAFMLRNLMIRGLVERESEPGKTGSYVYKVSFDFLRHMGVSSVEELPEYEKYKDLAATLSNNEEG